jgi:hypothetical protein
MPLSSSFWLDFLGHLSPIFIDLLARSICLLLGTLLMGSRLHSSLLIAQLERFFYLVIGVVSLTGKY